MGRGRFALWVAFKGLQQFLKHSGLLHLRHFFNTAYIETCFALEKFTTELTRQGMQPNCMNWNVLQHHITDRKNNLISSFMSQHDIVYSEEVQGDSFGTRPKKMRISRRLFIRFWTCVYYYIPCFMRSMSILVCRPLTSWRHRDNNWHLAPCRAQLCHCDVQ